MRFRIQSGSESRNRSRSRTPYITIVVLWLLGNRINVSLQKYRAGFYLREKIPAVSLIMGKIFALHSECADSGVGVHEAEWTQVRIRNILVQVADFFVASILVFKSVPSSHQLVFLRNFRSSCKSLSRPVNFLVLLGLRRLHSPSLSSRHLVNRLLFSIPSLSSDYFFLLHIVRPPSCPPLIDLQDKLGDKVPVDIGTAIRGILCSCPLPYCCTVFLPGFSPY